MSLDQALAFAKNNHERFLDELIQLVSIPSISTDADKKESMHQAADFVAHQLQQLGFQKVKAFPTALHPIVYGERLDGGNDAPTILIYGHYDVQPTDPEELWVSKPFIPEIRDGYLYGRGSSDMKGQVMASIKAIEAVLSQGNLPINIKFLVEGEEEIGSPNLAGFLKEHAEMLKCDVALNPDSGMVSPDNPTIVYALRGLAYFEIRVYGPDHDLHSGVFGGVIHNPAQALCEIITGMHDSQNRVTLPGFYDHVLELSAEEREQLARLPMNDQYYVNQTGSPKVWGEEGFTSTERVSARPTLEVHGLYSGFTGQGSKTVIPAWAMAKISTRLVPDQDPDEVKKGMVAYLQQHAPKSIRWEVTSMQGGFASISDTKLPATIALAKALESVWGIAPLYKREGGSVPVVADMQKILGIDSVITGFGLPDDNIHSPNERLHLHTWERGIQALIRFFFNLS
jgi:acetylornithine deacetylase/succinyl-diaminopimelate desuccinylase-like protein